MVAKNKTFDCVQMKHDIQERIARETEGMTTAEFQEWSRRRAEQFRRDNPPAPEPGGLEALFARLDREQAARGNGQ
jgi:hypothetical protein